MKLSIITINRNNAEGLRKTMQSVLSQTFRDFEYIIIDGASTDDSVQVIKEVIGNAEGEACKVDWVSEPDSGIYEAMNKGLRKASGEYTLILNSGDYLVDENVIEQIVSELDGTDIIQGNIVTDYFNKTIRNRGYGKSDIDFLDVMKGLFLHQASFCRLELFDLYGYFDESYKINGDTVFYARCLAFGDASFRYVDVDVAYFDNKGISSDPQKKWVKLREEEDERYRQLFSSRMWNLQKTAVKKIQLYNKLHAHRWSWFLTMAVAHVSDWIYKNK